jgi:glycerol kinase
MIWLAEFVPEVKERLATGKIKFGTIDSWLLYNLTGKYVTDASNASRTYLCNLNGEWD